MRYEPGYLYIALTVLMTVYGQLIVKWRMSFLGSMPNDFGDRLIFLIKAVFDPYVFSSFVAAFLASLAWMAALTRFDLSYAYPFMSLAFVLALILSYFFLSEHITWFKVLGMAMIVGGIIIASKA